MTAQVHEKLVLDDRLCGMSCCPGLPEGHPRIVASHTRDETCPDIVYSTACWRGYIGTWAIVGERFFLVKLVGRLRLVGDEPLFADWFTGTLRVPTGKLIHYVHGGFESVYEGELHIRVERGVVVGRRTVDNTNKDVDVEGPIQQSFPGFLGRLPEDEDT